MTNELAQELAKRLPDSGLAELLQQVEAGTVTVPDVRAWAGEHRSEVVALVGENLPSVPGLVDALDPLGLPPEGWHPRVSLGPATVGIDCPAATLTVAGEHIVVGLLPPTGATLSLNAGPAQGGGVLLLRPGGASGSLGLRMGPVDVVGFALLDVPGGTPSIVIVLGVHLRPPVQLSFGFALSAVGGVIGVNRRIDGDALRARLADGSALDALFPSDPVAGAPKLLSALGEIFRPQRGSHVVGPTFTITWLDIGVVSVVRVDVGLLLQLPDPKLILLGRAQVSLPAILALRLDVVGELDPGRRLMAIDAVLVDSRALAIFRVTGTAAMRLCWGDPPSVVVTIGGFYPGFKPEPASIPSQQRLALALDVPCPLTLRASGYLAITSNTFQVGAHFDVGIDLEVISASGFLRFDAIVQFDPFHVHVDYEAGWEVEVAIFSGGTTVSGWIDGPGPWSVHARVSISLLIDDFEWSDTFTIGSPGPPLDPAIASLAKALEPSLGLPSNLRANGGDDPHVLVQPRPGGVEPGTALCSPLATLTWAQRFVPLELTVSRAGGRRLAWPQSIRVDIDGTVAKPAGSAEDWFAPGTFLDLTQSEAMAIPQFQLLRAGTSLVLQPADGPSATASDDYESYYRRGPTALVPGGLAAALFMPLRAHAMMAGLGARAVVGNRTPLVHVVQEGWMVTRPGSLQPEPQPSAAHAVLASRWGGMAHTAADDPISVGAI